MKSVNPLANVGSKQPDKVLFDKAMDAMRHNRFDVARLTLQTLINTYPESEYIARAIKSNIRELEGALIRLMAFASLTGAELGLSTAQQVLKNIIETQEKKITIEQIQRRVGEHFGLRAQDLKMKSNSKVIAFPRQVAMFLVKQLTAASLPEIGKQFGGKHHTTVLHSINKIGVLRQTDRDLNRRINKLMDSLN